MYEEFYIVDDFGEIVGEGQSNVDDGRCVIQVFSLEYTFINIYEMEAFIWALGLDVM